jgi:23S rRNA (uracil1939-C5)-methyltransferase
MVLQKLNIIDLGSKGDGIASTGRFVPFTLPGEVVELNAEGGLTKVVKPSPHRVPASCRHFGQCGGCALQHLEQSEYLKWKRQQVLDAFAGEGLESKVADCIAVQSNSRRRATFTASSGTSGVRFGFQARHSHEVVDLEECPVLVSSISNEIEILRKLAVPLLQKTNRLQLAVLACDNGLDIALLEHSVLDDHQRDAISRWAVEHHVARVSHNGEIIVETEHPYLTIAGARLSPPPGSFSQAVAASEQHMIALVQQHLAKSRKVADLFAGFGTFALNIAVKSTVHAVEYEKDSLASLDSTARHISGIKPLTTEQRDLFRRPLQASELEAFDGAIFDPPRAGAEAQAKELARSGIPKIVAISCNPTTLARDVKILVDGGYKIKNITPIDQFLFTPHVEVVVLMERKKVRAKRKIFG